VWGRDGVVVDETAHTFRIAMAHKAPLSSGAAHGTLPSQSQQNSATATPTDSDSLWEVFCVIKEQAVLAVPLPVPSKQASSSSGSSSSSNKVPLPSPPPQPHQPLTAAAAAVTPSCAVPFDEAFCGRKVLLLDGTKRDTCV
jgi:hypothetical protein